MDQVNRRSALTLGAAALAGLVAYPLTSQTASAEEHRWKHIHEALESLRGAKEEIEGTGHEWGGHKKEAMEAIDRAIHQLEILRDWHE
jgi:hypothetical protein